jgi:putative SOS response-associated peptidase YedK
MCYDISFNASIELVTDYLPDVVVDPQIDIEYETTVHVEAQANKPYPILVRYEDKIHLTLFSWGINARGADMPSVWNAQSERILKDKHSYWYKIRHNRCLIPLTGIFEHREIKGWKKKVPYHVWLGDRKLFCVPGLYDEPNSHSNGLYTFTLITRQANSLMRLIHNAGNDAFRMPLFLTKELETLWLKEDLTEAEMQAIFDYEIPPEQLQYDTVYTIRTNKERPDGKGKLEHYTWENLPPLGRDTNVLELF